MWTDSHAHLSAENFKEDLTEVLERARVAKINNIINIATTPQELDYGLQLSKTYPWIYNVAATTPHDIKGDEEDIFSIYEKKAKDLVAIGETGLDYHYEYSPKLEQQSAFRRYIQLAICAHLPLVIHCREAFSDLFRIFDEEGYIGLAVLHCFTGTLEEALEGVKRGFYISFSGIVTFKKSISLQQVAKEIPLEHLLIETDCPYLAPQTKRGLRNEPSFIVETGHFLAALKGVSSEAFAEQTAKNAAQLFQI
jgi:TatD DNase family protein